MANRRFSQFRYSLEKMPVDLFLQVAIGTTGAPTINVAKSLGVTSITRNSAGNYTIALQDKYVRLLNVDATFVKAGVAAAQDVNVYTDSVSSGSLVIQCSAAGVATDPSNGETMKLCISVSNSTAS
jgi:hypothetical protein